ncbi:type VI secretion system membrane subunit TssM [Vibrio sp. TRT 21S02]|uniref:type VI secretion system membrane subunit TssM n=1 Tax=Vibrio sp. TRT 21S02 TaxID=3418507 RepID=UPI003CE871A2
MATEAPNTQKPSKGKLAVISLLVFILLSGIVFISAWFLFSPTYWIQSLIAALFVGMLSCGLCFWLLWRKRNKPKATHEHLLVQKRKKLLALHFKRMLNAQKRKKRLTSRYDQPIYLLLSEEPSKDRSIMTQMGYEAYKVDDFGNDIEFPILFWLSEHSILISISQGEDQHPEYIQTLCRCLMKWRPRQAINGLLLSTNVDSLLKSSEAITQHADQQKSQIKTFNHVFGLNLPIYNIITNMGNIADFCQFFSAFDEAKRNEVFGATSPHQKHGGIDANWFNDEYDHLISQLIANMSTALSGQLNQDYRTAISSAPYQFGLLKQSLWLFLQRLYRGEQLSDGLQFRGFYFTHTGQEGETNDLLASAVNLALGHEHYKHHSQIPVQQTLFAQHLMSHVVLNEHTLVGVNKRKQNFLFFAQTAYTFTWLAILGFVLAVIKFDFDYQNLREARADNMLERYKEAIAAAPYDIENMADNIPNLYSLHKIYALYLQPEPWYSLPFFPSSSIKQEVEQAYFNELEQVLIPSMENTLEKDLFVYVNLEDQAKTLSLLNSYRLLFNKERTNIEELKSYFINSLQEQGEADSVNLAQLQVLLDDVFTKDLVPVKANVELEQLAKKVINQTGVETLLYDHILNSAKYASRIDVRHELGNQFSQIFHFSPQYVGYMVPYLYTPSGFNELDLSVDSPVLKEALSAYEGVAGTAPSALEMYRISRDLKQMYQNDYINYWRDFIANVSVVEINNSAALNNTLDILTAASDNPVSNLYNIISKYTAVQLMTPSQDQNESTQSQADIDNDKVESARQIKLSFQEFHKLVATDEQGQKPIDTILGLLTKTQSWLSNYYSSNDPQKLAYQTLSASLKASNPISTLSSLNDNQHILLAQILKNITVQSNEMLLSLAHQYLNTTWQKEVYQPYQQTIAAFYPFSRGATSEASIADVKTFFKSSGTLDSYYNSKLKSFIKADDHSPYLPGLLPNSGLALDPSVWQMLEKASDIRSALFLSDPSKVTVQFQIKALEMSADITEFSIFAEKPIFSYQHGPMLWSNHSWTGENELTDSLTFELKAQQQSLDNQQYSGHWNWFRLVEPRVKNATSQDTHIEFSHEGSKVRLAIRTQGQSNPFVPGFFAGFTLPSSI